MLTYYCDESYASDPQQGRKGIFVVGGFLAEEKTWTKIERRWAACNKRHGVSQYHATEVNGRRGEFKGWTDAQRNKYSKKLLEILKDQENKLCGVSIGINRKDYERLVSESGRAKWGTAYTAAFKTCVAWIAQLMGNFPPDCKFSVVMARSQFQKEALDAFDILKDKTHWPPHVRLGSYALDDPSQVVPLQAADLISYETFRLMETHGKEPRRERRALGEIFHHNFIRNHLYVEEKLREMATVLEKADVGPNEFVTDFSDDVIKPDMFSLYSAKGD